jgi:hypothetical protein
MSTTWEEASACPADGTTGKIVGEVQVKRTGPFDPPQGKLVTLECQQTRCSYHVMGWTVQVRPDGTVPDKVVNREKQFPKAQLTEARKQMLRDLAAQVAEEQKPGVEVRNPHL